MNLKQMVESNEYVVVVDTNVLLNIYRYSPEFSEFALICLKSIKDYIVLPATVYIEYERHCKAEFAKMQGRVQNAGNETSDQIKRAKAKVLATCDRLDRLHFPDIDELRDRLSEKLDDLESVLDDFFGERSSLNLISYSWDGIDYLKCLVEELGADNKIMLPLSQKDIYTWCEEGEKRYKKEIPPGFKDAKSKDGVRKYSDLFLWKETLRFAAEKKKNIIFVTDDIKMDWWETSESRLQFHHKLVGEFVKTGQQLVSFVSRDFFSEVATAYGVVKTDAVEIALRMTDTAYCEKIADDVLESIMDEFVYSNTSYIDSSSAHVGSEGIDELEIERYNFLSAERISRNGDVAVYHFKFNIIATGVSYEYWGRDDDTKEAILSEGTDHVFEGILVVRVTREANVYLDFEDDTGFETAEILTGDLKETHYNGRWDEPEPGVLGFCPDCGCSLGVENDGGNGFCIQCSSNHD